MGWARPLCTVSDLLGLTMSPQLSLTPGVAGPARFVFHHGGIGFEDVGVGYDEMPALKPKLP